MLTPRHLEIVEGLFDLDPDSNYAQRAVAGIAELASAAGYRLSIDGGAEIRNRAGVGEGFVIPLTHGKAAIGKLHLYAADGSGRLPDEKARLARWAAKILSKGLHYAKRLSQTGSKPEIDVKALLDGTPLTPRERDVVGKLVAGASTREISEVTGLTISTVNTYMKRIFAKLGVHSRVELLARVTGTHASIRAVAE
jgi:DNA-binding CsgD family transcriptional regulator